MEELSIAEAKNINGGNVPVAYYMDDDVIKANGENIDKYVSFVVGFLVGLFD